MKSNLVKESLNEGKISHEEFELLTTFIDHIEKWVGGPEELFKEMKREAEDWYKRKTVQKF